MNSKSAESILFNIAELREITDNFLDDLSKASQGQTSSLPFISNPLPQNKTISDIDIVQAMVIGGSLFQSSLAVQKNGKISFLNKTETQLPIFQTRNDLISFVEQNLDSKSTIVALNFAYPLDPILINGKLDGVLKTATKEHAFEGLIGKTIGLELEEYFLIKYNRKIKFSVANDTVCLLLSGLEEYGWQDLAGGIVGTGLNFGFFLLNDNLINIESSNFDRFPVSEEAREIDIKSSTKGKGLLEKETSGKYLFNHYNLIVKNKSLPYPQIESTIELNQIAIRNEGESSEIAKSLFKKSAMLTAMQISGITRFKRRNMNFVMEGSLYWKADNYKEQVNTYLDILIPEWKIQFIHLDDSSLKGAAALAFR